MADNALLVDNEQAAQGDCAVGSEDTVVGGNLFGEVGNERVIQTAKPAGFTWRIDPSEVRVMTVHADAENFCIPLLELGYLVVEGDDFRRADKREIQWVEIQNYVLLTFVVAQANVFELPINDGCRLEFWCCFLDECTHVLFFLWVIGFRDISTAGAIRKWHSVLRDAGIKFQYGLSMIRLALIMCVLPVVSLFAETPAALNATDERAIQLALRALKMTERDLSFQKTNVESELIFPQARQFLQAPLRLPGYAEMVLSNCTSATELRDLANFASQQFDPLPTFYDVRPYAIFIEPGFLTKLPAPVSEAIQQIVWASQLSAGLLIHALPSDGAAALAGFAPEALHIKNDIAEIESWHQQGIDTGPLQQFLDRDEQLELQDAELADAILNASDKFNNVQLMYAATQLAGAVDKAAALLRTNQFTGDFQYETDTKLGKVIVTGTGKHVFTNEAFLIIGLGGDNVYSNSAGGANGLAGRPISIVIDLGNNSQFVSKRSFSQGSGLFGVGILAALGSNCTFQAKHMSQGAGFFGCGILMTGPGKQTLEADTFCQGAGMFGAGILWQRGENATCRAAYLAQGFGGIQGVGLLLNSSSNNLYFAGGKYPCPWLPGHYFSLSQGFGYGLRPYAGGGIGILCDLGGHNHYEADVYGQGASYWYSVGLLLDAAGNNRYDANQYCQGAGIHLSSGALVDWGGNNSFTAGHICQGAAHDYSVGMLISRAGNNNFTGETTAQGAAINNSFAMLLNHAGTNTYVGTDPKQSQAAGHDGEKREYGSIALLLDLGGHGNYSQGQTNNAIWLKPLYGVGFDSEVSPIAPDRARPYTPNQPPPRPAGRLNKIAPVDPRQPIEHLFRLATSDHPETGKAWDELKQRAAEALPYLITRLASPNIMVRIKVEELVDHLNTNSIPPLIAGIHAATDDDVARLCCYYLARFDEKARAGIPAVLQLINRDRCRTTAFYTLGHMRATEAFRPAIAALDESRELVRLRAAQALGKIGDCRAIPALLRKLDDEMYDVRYAAEDALVKFGQPSRDPLRDAYRHATPRAQAHILEALAKLGDETALILACEYYRNDDSLVRNAVLKALTAALTTFTQDTGPTEKQ